MSEVPHPPRFGKRVPPPAAQVQRAPQAQPAAEFKLVGREARRARRSQRGPMSPSKPQSSSGFWKRSPHATADSLSPDDAATAKRMPLRTSTLGSKKALGVHVQPPTLTRPHTADPSAMSKKTDVSPSARPGTSGGRNNKSPLLNPLDTMTAMHKVSLVGYSAISSLELHTKNKQNSVFDRLHRAPAPATRRSKIQSDSRAGLALPVNPHRRARSADTELANSVDLVSSSEQNRPGSSRGRLKLPPAGRHRRSASASPSRRSTFTKAAIIDINTDYGLGPGVGVGVSSENVAKRSSSMRRNRNDRPVLLPALKGRPKVEAPSDADSSDAPDLLRDTTKDAAESFLPVSVSAAGMTVMTALPSYMMPRGSKRSTAVFGRSSAASPLSVLDAASSPKKQELEAPSSSSTSNSGPLTNHAVSADVQAARAEKQWERHQALYENMSEEQIQEKQLRIQGRYRPGTSVSIAGRPYMTGYVFYCGRLPPEKPLVWVGVKLDKPHGQKLPLVEIHSSSLPATTADAVDQALACEPSRAYFVPFYSVVLCDPYKNIDTGHVTRLKKAARALQCLVRLQFLWRIRIARRLLSTRRAFRVGCSLVGEYGAVDLLAVETTDDRSVTIADLADHLTKSPLTNTNSRRVRALFRWICAHISYSPYRPTEDPVEVLRSRMGGDAGIANLFCALARAAGFACVIIRGYGKGEVAPEPGMHFDKPNHSWNAVYINGAWKLVDCLWSIGYQSGKEFVTFFSDCFFLTPPPLFVMQHLPVSVERGDEYVSIASKDASPGKVAASTPTAPLKSSPPPTAYEDAQLEESVNQLVKTPALCQLLDERYTELSTELYTKPLSTRAFRDNLMTYRAFVEHQIKMIQPAGCHSVHCSTPYYTISFEAPVELLYNVVLVRESDGAVLGACWHVHELPLPPPELGSTPDPEPAVSVGGSTDTSMSEAVGSSTTDTDEKKEKTTESPSTQVVVSSASSFDYMLRAQVNIQLVLPKSGKYSVTVRAALSRRSKSTLFSDLFKLKLRSTVGVRDIGVEKTQIYVGYINRKDSTLVSRSERLLRVISRLRGYFALGRDNSFPLTIAAPADIEAIYYVSNGRWESLQASGNTSTYQGSTSMTPVVFHVDAYMSKFPEILVYFKRQGSYKLLYRFNGLEDDIDVATERAQQVEYRRALRAKKGKGKKKSPRHGALTPPRPPSAAGTKPLVNSPRSRRGKASSTVSKRPSPSAPTKAGKRPTQSPRSRALRQKMNSDKPKTRGGRKVPPKSLSSPGTRDTVRGSDSDEKQLSVPVSSDATSYLLESDLDADLHGRVILDSNGRCFEVGLRLHEVTQDHRQCALVLHAYPIEDLKLKCEVNVGWFTATSRLPPGQIQVDEQLATAVPANTPLETLESCAPHSWTVRVKFNEAGHYVVVISVSKASTRAIYRFALSYHVRVS